MSNRQILIFRFVYNILCVYKLSGICKNGGLARNHGFSQEILENKRIINKILQVPTPSKIFKKYIFFKYIHPKI